MHEEEDEDHSGGGARTQGRQALGSPRALAQQQHGLAGPWLHGPNS